MNPELISQSDAVAKKETRFGGRSGFEVVAMTLLGVITFCGGMWALLDMVASESLSEYSLGFSGLGQMAAGLSTMAMIWFRKRSLPTSTLTTLGIVFWFIGASIVGNGLGLLALPTDHTFLQNFGYTTFFCFAPGGVLALLGLGFYSYEQFRSSPTARAGRSTVQARQARQKDYRTEKIKRAQEYLSRITRLSKKQKGQLFTRQGEVMADVLENWEDRLEQLVERLNTFDSNDILQRDLEEVPQAIANLKAGLDKESDPAIRAQMNETLEKQQAHQRQLEALSSLIRRTDLEIDETLATIGTIYSQLQLIGAKDIDSDRARRLSDDIEEEANKLGDLLEAMDDVYQERSL